MISDEAAVAQQRARAAGDRAGGPGVVQRLQREAGQRPDRGGAGDDPDQVSGGDEVEQHPADQRAEDEGGRAPQPQRSVVEAIALHAPQRIGIRQRHHGRPQAAGQGVDQEHQHRQMLGAQDEKAQGGGKGGHDDAAAQGLTPFRKARHQRQHRKSGHRGNGRDQPYPKRIDPDRLQPDREKRQMGAGHAEQRAVEQRHPRRELLRCVLRSDGDL